jgi:hypothetical protein
MTSILALTVLAGPATCFAGAKEQAQRLFDRLNGYPISVSDPRLAQMTSKIASGDLLGAAEIATNEDGFYNITLKKWGATMSNRSEVAIFQDPDRAMTPFFGSLSDFNATIIGAVRDNLDARLLLTGDFIYKADSSIDKPGAATPPFATNLAAMTSIHSDQTLFFTNHHYIYLEQANVNLRAHLVQTRQKVMTNVYDGYGENPPPALIDNPDTAGLLTSRAFMYSHLMDGTNRRFIEFAFREFTCRPISQWADAQVSDVYVRRDVDRAPGGNINLFKTRCLACHGPMDGMAGATAHFDFYKPGSGFYVQGGFPIYATSKVNNGYRADVNGVFLKMNQNATNFPSGHMVIDDSWVNQATHHQNTSFGWKGPLSGNGVHSLGVMLANSDAFPQCMAKRVFTEVCRRPPDTSESTTIKALGDQFVSDGYNLRILFERAAILPTCLPQQ